MIEGLDAPAGARFLDYGCADQPYRHLLPLGAEYVGADLPGNPETEIILDPQGTVPVEDASFDVVLSTQVLEHVEDPTSYLDECFRVLRPGGKLLLSTHGMMFYHPDPVDLWRWTCEGLRQTINRAGFRVERFEGIVGLAATGMQFVQDALLQRTPRILRGPIALVMQALISLVDRLERPTATDRDAMVFAVVASKPRP